MRPRPPAALREAIPGERHAFTILSAGRAVPVRTITILGAYLLGYALWQLFGWGGDGQRSLIGDLAFVPLIAFAAIEAWRAGGRCKDVRGLLTGWRLIGLALMAYCLGDLAQLYYETSLGEYPSPSLADPLYLAFYPLFIAGILKFPRARSESRSRRLRAALDATTITVAGTTIVWYVVLGPEAYAGSANTLSGIVGVAYPAGDLILIVALARLLLGIRVPALRRSLQLLATGMSIFVVTDVLYGWTLLHSVYTGGSALDSGWMLAFGVFVLAAASQGAVRSSDWGVDPAELDPTSGTTGAAGALTYVSALTVFALFVGAHGGDSFFPGLSLALTAALVGVLALLRQHLAQRELARVHAELRRAHAELSAVARTDALTGLANHRALASAIDGELERSRRYKRRCALLFLDVDHFKALNDGFGHEAGDAALCEIASVVDEALRAIDTLGRWGGEEFIAVLPEQDGERALATAERVRAAVAGHIFGAVDGHVTISIGVAEFPRDGVGRGDLIGAADRAMYAAKRMGRNRAFSAADPTVERIEGGGADDDARQFGEGVAAGAADALAMLADARDEQTGFRSARLAILAQRLALALGCTVAQACDTYVAARIHDIGRAIVADAILSKPESLSEAEWREMRRVPALGAEVVERVGSLAKLAPIIRSHHEHYDGHGYPDGLRGEEIPLQARILAVADAYEAMVSDRPYRRRLGEDEARESLRRGAGAQFDPTVVAALERLLDGEWASQPDAARDRAATIV